RPPAAGLDHGVDRGSLAREHRLDRTASPVADPALKAAVTCRLLDEGAEAHTLHAAVKHHMTDRFHRVPSSLRLPAPSGRSSPQAWSARMWRGGRFHSRAAATTSSI